MPSRPVGPRATDMASPQLGKVGSGSGVAVRSTGVPAVGNGSEPFPGHAMPTGLETTVPVPEPAIARLTVNSWRNLATMVWLVVTVTVQVPCPEHGAVSHPSNM